MSTAPSPTAVTGHLIWEALARPLTQEKSAARLTENYKDVPVEQVAADVKAFLQALSPGGSISELPDKVD